MDKYLNSVLEFHKCFDHPIKFNKGADNDKDINRLRLNLLFEELHELSVAMGVEDTFRDNCTKILSNQNEPVTDIDHVETIDALVDIQYVLSGAILALGYTDVFSEAFDEVHRSNMTKLCSSIHQAESTREYYARNKDIELENIGIKEKGGYFIVYRISDNKVLKNMFYSKAELAKYV